MLKKFKKNYRRGKDKISINCNLHYGKYAIQSIENNNLNFKQIESFKKIIKNKIKKRSLFLNLKLSLNYSITKKKKNSRMGRGKGEIQFYVCKVKKGQIIFEFDNIDYEKIKNLLDKAIKKLPIKTRILIKSL